MTNLKKLLIESLYYHQEKEAELAIKCFKEWLKEKYDEEQTKQFYGPYSCDVCTAPANTIEKLLEELATNENKNTKEKP